MQTLPLDPLSATFQALADPTRRAILARLATGACSVTELAEPFDMSMPAVSKHLRVLERAGLVSRSRDAQRRPCRIEPDALKQAWEWAGGFQAMWQQRLDNLESYMTQLQSAQQPSNPPAHQPSSPATHQKKERTRARRKQ